MFYKGIISLITEILLLASTFEQKQDRHYFDYIIDAHKYCRHISYDKNESAAVVRSALYTVFLTCSVKAERLRHFWPPVDGKFCSLKECALLLYSIELLMFVTSQTRKSQYTLL